ncbi:type IV secretory system conjugative DNA transfer family protein [Dactylosporangium sp. CA-092794]|uniref:type IV secretory system conjugative DNA transfer family protein n=1 Tax=Dactylosporangium sp. CA-092794 TaxID=3239929 RepID=UPI003D94C68D
MARTRTIHPRLFGAGLVATATGWALTQAPDATNAAGYGYALGVAGVATAAGTVYHRFRGGAAGSNRLIGRWDRNSTRNGGTASRWQILTTSSRWAMYRRAAVLRPSLRDAGWWQRWRTPALSYATPLCTVGRHTVWTSCEESTLRIGIPGTGKTAELACRVIDAPGGALVASTAADLYELTAQLRARRGPVTVFNPGGIGGVASTLRWSPLAGCGDPATAARRAADLIGPTGSEEGERWNIHARRALSVFLHAAALGGYRIRDIQRWVANPDGAGGQVVAALAASPNAAEMLLVAEQTLRMTARTRDGVMLALAPAVAWVTHPAAAACGDADPAAADTLVADLTDRAGTLYLLGDEDGTVGPLVAALTAEIVHRARATAAARPGGRLDPGLALVLDEVALICPTPLDRWMAELRKRSIVVHAACQGLGQLRQRWGVDGAAMILNAAAAVLVFGGCKDPRDLAAFTDLAGERDVTTTTRDADGRVSSSTTRRAPVISAAMLAGLPNHRAMLIRRGMPVALAATPIVWRRRDVRRALAGRTRTARAAAWTVRTVRRAVRARAEVAA